MSQFHSLTVSNIERETPSSVVVSLKVPGNLMAVFAFKAGQYLTLETTINGDKVRRAYSLCSAPHESVLKVGIKKVEGGVFSVYANDSLQVGDIIDVMPPEGKFIVSPVGNTKKYAAFAAGSGITPVLSIIKTVLKEEPQSHFVLVYGNKSKSEAMFYDELLTLQAESNERLHIEFIYSEKTEEGCRFGRIDKPIVNYILNNKFEGTTFDAFYLCGPEAMIDTVSDTLKEKGVDEKNIYFELFTPSKTEATISTQDGNTLVTVVVDDETETFTMSQKHTVLEAALAHKVDAPYSCQGGICSSCLARVIEGEAEMRKNQILTEAEIAEGLILTCQAQPTTATLSIDYDDV